MSMICLDKLSSVLKDEDQLLIIPHNDPDPDAIAAAVGLRYLAAQKFGICSPALKVHWDSISHWMNSSLNCRGI
jgi:nanoRNase/pAp phosphatase (c-di-AMP/oligoRNAs hydrolase)